MKRCLSQTALALCALVVALPVSAAQRTFVSTGGVNNPACSLVAPCRDFTAAITATWPGGEVIVLDSGGYGKVTITQSVSIIAPPGVYAGISVFAPDDGVTVAAGASDKVTLRGLTIIGQGGSRGIVVASSGEVHIEQCIVANLLTHGIEVSPEILGTVHVHIRSTLVHDNGEDGLAVIGGAPEIHVMDSQFVRNYYGIRITRGTLDANRIVINDSVGPGLYAEVGGASVVISLTDSALSGNGGTGAGAFPDGQGSTVRMAITRSVSARNGLNGISAATYGAGGVAFLTVSDSSIVENANYGVLVSGSNGIGVISGSTVTGNANFDLVQANLAELRSSGTNTLTGRGAADVSGALTPNPLK